MESFSARIRKIGINPYVLVPAPVLKSLFSQAGKDKGAIAVKITLGGNEFIQNLVKYKGKWRLYLNTPMRKSAGIDVGDIANINILFDPTPRSIPIHSKLKHALEKNKIATAAFGKLSPSRQKEIMRYINALKTDESVERNIKKVIQHLAGKERFVGRDINNK